MAETLNSYLDLHKLEHHKLELEYQWFDPNLMIQNVIDRFRKELKIGDISITSIIDTGVPNKIYGDQFRLEHALRSLLSGGIDISDRLASSSRNKIIRVGALSGDTELHCIHSILLG